MTGFLFEMGDSGGLKEKIITAAAMDDSQYLEMSESAYRFACDKFSEKDHYRYLLKIYKDVIVSKEL